MTTDEMTEYLRGLYVLNRDLEATEEEAHREFRDWLVMQS